MFAADAMAQRSLTLTLMRQGCSHEGAKGFVDLLAEKYAEPHRFHHSAKHVDFMIDNLEVEPTDELLLSCYFHDCCYNPNNTDNEACSAKFADDWLCLFTPKVFADRVKHLIMLTKHPSTPNLEDAEEVEIVRLDLLVLASSRRDYTDYVFNIRNEHQDLSDEDFSPKRQAWLEMLLEHRIFPYVKRLDETESLAQRNLREELDARKRGWLSPLPNMRG